MEDIDKKKILGMRWSVITNGTYYIGNVNVSEMIFAAEKILPYLEEQSKTIKSL